MSLQANILHLEIIFSCRYRVNMVERSCDSEWSLNE